MPNDDYLKGWQAARDTWQRTGSVSPYPPEVEYQRTLEASGKKPQPEVAPSVPPKKVETAPIGETKPKSKPVKEARNGRRSESES